MRKATDGLSLYLDLEKFFDRMNHDKLMGQIAKRIEDKRLLKLIRAFLNAGVMENGLVSPSVEGTPQGGPLSPLRRHAWTSLGLEVFKGVRVSQRRETSTSRPRNFRLATCITALYTSLGEACR